MPKPSKQPSKSIQSKPAAASAKLKTQAAAQVDSAPQIDERHARFKLKIAPSKIHRWGIFAAEDIPANRKIIEYTGERCNRKVTKLRAEGPLNYMFTLNSYWAIDGSVGGSGAEYMNHCCEPNTFARILKEHILYISMRPIRKGEELTIDYHFGKDVEHVPCHCGARACRTSINLKD